MCHFCFYSVSILYSLIKKQYTCSFLPLHPPLLPLLYSATFSIISPFFLLLTTPNLRPSFSSSLMPHHPPLNLFFILRGVALPTALNLTLLHKEREKETDPWEIYRTLLSHYSDLEHVFRRESSDREGEEHTKDSRPRQQTCLCTNGVSELLWGPGYSFHECCHSCLSDPGGEVSGFNIQYKTVLSLC